jgi:hypothetical protein
MKLHDDENAAFRASALGGFSTRSAAITQRQISAVARIWSSVIDLTPFATTAKDDLTDKV